MFRLIRRVFSLVFLLAIIIVAIIIYRWFKSEDNFLRKIQQKPQQIESVLEQTKDKFSNLSDNIDFEKGADDLLNQGEKFSQSVQDYIEQINLADFLSRDKLNAYLNKIQAKLETPSKYYQHNDLSLFVGFNLEVFAENLASPRVIIHAPNGGYLVSLPQQGRVVKILDSNGDGRADQIKTIIKDKLNQPHGLLIKCFSDNECLLYVAENNQVSIFDYDLATDTAVNKRKIIDLPSGGGHWTRTIIETAPDQTGKTSLLISVGSSCNVCQEDDWRRAKVLIADLDGSNLREYARGLRNSVFMTLHPVDASIWATEMGRDWLGDDLPPDEINILQAGVDYGWPNCYGNNEADVDFNKNASSDNVCFNKQGAHINIPAHSAPLGLAFIPEEGWPENMHFDLLVAYHGSWNRSEAHGYKIVRYKLDEAGNYLGEEDFISGWLRSDGSIAGRPVDILIEPGGTMYFTDDYAGKVYRLQYQGQ